ncbi:AGAP009015-PA, partial [Anopheles gambiae str. PEST]
LEPLLGSPPPPCRGKTLHPTPGNVAHCHGATGDGCMFPASDSVLKEAVDAVVNSFAKHTQGYGRGKHVCCFR